MKRISALLLSVVMFSNVIATVAPETEVETVVESTDNKVFALKVAGGTVATAAVIAAALYAVGKTTNVSPALTEAIKNLDDATIAALVSMQEAAKNGFEVAQDAASKGLVMAQDSANTAVNFVKENKVAVSGAVTTVAVAGFVAADLARGENSVLRKLAADIQSKFNGQDNNNVADDVTAESAAA